MTSQNQYSTELLKKYLENSLERGPDTVAFFILSGPANIGKSEIAINISKEILGPYFHHDFLHIQDFSQQLGKFHTLKVEHNPTNSVSKELQDNYNYTDLGIREINFWLQESFAGKAKILLIENIERMNNASMNAFLKSCEEPLSSRVIIATSSNKTSLLDTILSRAIIIPFHEMDYNQMLQYCNQNNILSSNQSFQEFLCLICMGKPRLLDEIYLAISNDALFESTLRDLITILKNNDIESKFSALQIIQKNGYIEPVIDGLIAYYIFHDDLSNSQKWLKIKKMLQANIKIENLLFYSLLD